MSSHDFNINEPDDMLQLNIDQISKDLNNLIVTDEQEFGMATMDQSALRSAGLNTQNFIYNANIYQGQQQILNRNVIPTPKLNYYLPFQPQLPMANIHNIYQHNAETQSIYNPTNYLPAANNLPPSTLGSTQNPFNNATATPIYEFYYLRQNDRKALDNNASNRRVPKMYCKNYNQKLQNCSTLKEEIKVDLSKIDLDFNGNENSTLNHLFELLRDLHNAVAETPPSFESNTDSQFVETFAPLSLNKMSTMPSTLNIQNQVKQASRKLTNFIGEMQSILYANKIFEREMLAECEYYLNNLQQSLKQLENYKRIEMEHKRGQFLRDEVRVHSERLTLLLEHINRQIREVHIKIIAYDWYMGVKYRGEVHLAATVDQSKIKEVTKKSKFGIINEILQLSSNTSVKKSMEKSLTEAENLNQIESLKPEMKPIKSPTKLLYNEDDKKMLVKSKPLLNKKNIFMANEPDQTRRAGVNNNTNNNGYSRQPAFYIG